MTKFTTSPGSAYEVASGITAEEAAKLGLVVVENIYNGTVPSPVYGRYLDAPKGHALGVTVPATDDTKVIGAGAPSAAAPANDTLAAAQGSKGNLVNPDDPFVHGNTGEDSMHKDGAVPPAPDAAGDLKDAVEEAVNANKAAAKKSK